jgi:hypothetical protein
MREGRFADTLWPGEQPRMVQLALRPGGGELLNCTVLPDDHGNRS